jgi:hypothetical protein
MWKAHEPTDFWAFFRASFPSLFIKKEGERPEPGKWQALIHRGLDDHERERFHEAGKELKRFVSDARAFDEDRLVLYKNECVPFNYTSYL